MRKSILFCMLLGMFTFTLKSFAGDYHPGEVRSYVQPSMVQSVSRPVISLNGDWRFKISAKDSWSTIQVPGEPVMQGYGLSHDEPFYYKKTFTVPADFRGKHVILRFNGVYTQARLRINGQFVREHRGGFTRWETDVTRFVKPGKRNELQLEIIDRIDDISYASGYAHHPIGGILRDVELFALPSSHLMDIHVDTHFDQSFTDAKLHFGGYFQGQPATKMKIRLTDPKGHSVSLQQDTYVLQQGENNFVLPVSRPLKWDAEHPNLYCLEVSTLAEGDVPAATFKTQFGFRQIEVVKDRVLVNGLPVKLRGACRHDIHPTLGRTTTAELDSLDVIRFKQANMNFVRTSHYPPSERFLEYCDKLGVYVESETAVCFINTHRQKNYAPAAFQNDSAYTGQFLGQCQEMVKSFRTHPSVLMWSIGNECVYGFNFQHCWDWVKAADTTRPVIFSYPGTAMDKKAKIYDILSMHYQDVNGNLRQWGADVRNFQGYGLPVIFDEWAHPACYTYSTLQHDPNIREFWGQSIDKMWSGLFPTTGGLGGGIWSYIDETFSVPTLKKGTDFWKEFAHTAKPAGFQGDCVGYGEWGIVDVWRRPKPEFWATKKAYSPVRILADRYLSFTSGHPIMLTVYNRFDHTNLSEIKAQYTYKGVAHPLSMVSVQPHQKGMLTLPATDWQESEPVLIEFFTSAGELIDASQHYLGKEQIVYPSQLSGNTLTVSEEDGGVVVKGDGFEVPFDAATGLMKQVKAGEDVLIEEGPYLHLDINLNHLTGAEVRAKAHHISTQPADWRKTSFRYEQKADGVYVYVSGTYKDIRADYQMKITARGELSISYTTAGTPNGYLRETGLSFQLSPAIHHLDWHRDAYWNYYPANSFAGRTGSVDLYSTRQAAYREKPVQPWQMDTHDYYYWSDRGTNCQQPLVRMAKGVKENIHHYTLSTRAKNHQLAVVSKDASVACRMEKMADETLRLFTNNRWDYPEIAWGNYCKILESHPCFGHIQLQVK